MSADVGRRLTTSQVVAHNLAAARHLREMTQPQAVEALESVTGQRWSVNTWSNAERSVTGRRVHEFTAEELAAFCVVFELPLIWFFLPPKGAEMVLRCVDDPFVFFDSVEDVLRILLRNDDPAYLERVDPVADPKTLELRVASLESKLREIESRFPEVTS